MTKPLFALVLLCSLSQAQTAPPKSSAAPAKQPQATKTNDAAPAQKPASEPTPAKAAPVASVGPDETVVTIPGVCASGVTGDACVTRLTRSELERLMSATNANAAADPRKVATVYSQLLTMANQAQKQGLDKDPIVQVQLHVQSLSILAQALQKKIFESSKPTAAEIESYHAENSAKYEEINLKRIVVLKTAGSDVTPEQQKAIAEQIRTRAAAGEDTDKLQIEAYKATKSAGTPPSTALGWKRRGGIDQRHEQQVLALHAGEVSQLLEDGQDFYIYKIDSKRLVPLPTVEKEIESTLQLERAKKTLQQMVDSSKPQFNEAYFGAEPPKTTPPTTPK